MGRVITEGACLARPRCQAQPGQGAKSMGEAATGRDNGGHTAAGASPLREWGAAGGLIVHAVGLEGALGLDVLALCCDRYRVVCSGDHIIDHTVLAQLHVAMHSSVSSIGITHSSPA